MKNYHLGLYEKSMPNSLSLKEKMLIAKEAGYDFLEISIDETDEKLSRLDYDDKKRFEIISSMCETRMPIRTMCLSGHRKYPLGSCDDATRLKSIEIMEKAINFAWDLGIRIIQIAGYDVYYEKSTFYTKELFLKSLEKCIKMASSKGITLAFETMETEFMNTVYKAIKYVNKINSPYLSVYPDSGNITNAAKLYGLNEIEDLRYGEGKISAVHLKESLPGKYREIPFGTGHVDFDMVIQTALSLNIRLFVTEFWCTNDDWLESIYSVKKFITEKFNKFQ